MTEQERQDYEEEKLVNWLDFLGASFEDEKDISDIESIEFEMCADFAANPDEVTPVDKYIPF